MICAVILLGVMLCCCCLFLCLVYVIIPKIKLICSKLDASYLVHIYNYNVMIVVPYDIVLLFMFIKHHMRRCNYINNSTTMYLLDL